MSGRVARSAAAAVALVVAAAIGGCSGADAGGESAAVSGPDVVEARPLTVDEAQRLAAMRFTNYDTGVRAVQFEVDDRGQRYVVDGWVDFAAGLGYAVASDSDDDVDPILLAWTDGSIASHPIVDPSSVGRPPLPPPDTAADAVGGSWTSSALTPSESLLHAALAVILEAGHDRPDNALLLRQTDARWLRSDEIDGVSVDVIAGPSSDHAYDPATATTAADGSDATVRYWIGASGELRRMEVRLGGGSTWTVVDLEAAADVDFAAALTESG